MYYSYHAKAKQLIKEGHLTEIRIMERWNDISPAMVLFFDNHRPMPIREYRWEEYWKYFEMQRSLPELKSKNSMKKR